MRRRWYAGVLLLALIIALSGCGADTAADTPQNPLQFTEAPVEAETYDWSQVTQDAETLAAGLDNYPSAVTDWTAEGMNLETGGELPALDFGEDDTTYQTVEGDPNEIPLEGSLPLEGTNNDPNLGMGNQFPDVSQDTETEGGDGNVGGEPVATPTPEPTPQPTEEPDSSDDSEQLAKTADVPLAVYAVVGFTALIILLMALKKPSQASN